LRSLISWVDSSFYTEVHDSHAEGASGIPAITVGTIFQDELNIKKTFNYSQLVFNRAHKLA